MRIVPATRWILGMLLVALAALGIATVSGGTGEQDDGASDVERRIVAHPRVDDDGELTRIGFGFHPPKGEDVHGQERGADDIFPSNRFLARRLFDESADEWLRGSLITVPLERSVPTAGEVGTAGGFATAKDGAMLIVPAAAARRGAEITARAIADEDLPSLPDFASAYLAAWDFHVEGGIHSSVTSRLPLPDAEESWAHVHFVDGEWALTPFHIEDGAVVAELESLSRFALVRLRDFTDTAPMAITRSSEGIGSLGQPIAADSGPLPDTERQRQTTTAATSDICRESNSGFSVEIGVPFTRAAIKGCAEGTIYAPVFTIENPQPYWQQVCSALETRERAVGDNTFQSFPLYERGAGHLFQSLADCDRGVGTLIPPKSFAVWRASDLVPLEQFRAHFGPVPMVITIFEWILYIIPLGEIVDIRGNWELLHYVQETLLRVPEIDRFIGHLTSGDWFGAMTALAKTMVNGDVWKALQRVLTSEFFWSQLGERAGFSLNKAALAKASAVANFGRLASYLWTLIKASHEVGAGMLMGSITFQPSREALRLIRERVACRRQARETGEPCAADQEESADASSPVVSSDTSPPAAEAEVLPPIGDGSLMVLGGTRDLYQAHVVDGSRFKRLILNAVVFNGYGFRLGDVRSVEQAEFDRWTTTDLARLGDDERVWRLIPDGSEGVQRWLDITPRQFEAAGFDWNAVISINRTEFYAWREGPPITAAELGLESDDSPPVGESHFSPISVGQHHSCALRETGAIKCWINNDGQTGAPAGRFSAVSVGEHHSCGLRETGAVECWINDHGQTDAPAGRFSAVSVGVWHTCGLRETGVVECWGYNEDGRADAPAGRFSAVSVGERHSCGLRETGVVQCWGANWSGQTDAPAGRFSAVSAGLDHTCGLRETGAIECWGWNEYGQADAPAGRFSAVSAGWWYTCGLRETGAVQCWGGNSYGKADAPAGQFSALSAGVWHTCGLRETGVVECWGYNEDGQTDAPAGRFSAVSVGYDHTCGLRETGAVQCWGNNDDGQTDAPAGQFSAVSAGLYHTCGLLETGAVECWGASGNGQADAPAGRFSAVSAGGFHTCGLRDTGAVQCWGNNDFGQADAPAGRFSAVSVGWNHTCGLRDTGAVQCWGYNGSGQADAPAGRFSAVSAGMFHNCGLRETGAVVCWGANWDGRADAPAGRFSAVSAGDRHSCGLREAGAVVCWGNNDDGQTDAPAGRFSAVSTGGLHSCGLRETGAVECWGGR